MSSSLHVALRQSKYESLLKGAVFVGIILVLGGSYKLSEIDLPLLWSEDGLHASADFLTGLIPPAHSREFLSYIIKPTLDTLYIAILGTLMGVFLAFPLSLLASHSLTQMGKDESAAEQTPLKKFCRTAPYVLSRGLLNLLRSIPELVWALIFVRAVGLGPLPGVLALGIAYAGMLGKLYSEILDAVDTRPIEALRSTGASKLNIVFYGYLPLALPDLIAYTLYRWECGIRAAVVLGFVGAGGIGQEVELSMRMFNYHEVSTLLMILCLLVGMVDIISGQIRKRMI
ncbi:MAG: phosphonate ABC transporter, permease protein PhnE [Mariprofundus sp.]|nr:phosphonate ABC transporter, permease protein PhnE [Mariprofundus sp.]